MSPTLAFSIDKDVIKIYHINNIKFFCQNSINITLNAY